MKKFKKNDLRLDKEVITSLSENELNGFRGGLDSRADCFYTVIVTKRFSECYGVTTCQGPPIHPESYECTRRKDDDCLSKLVCVDSMIC